MTSATHLNINVIDVQFGYRVKVIQPSNLYGCKLGDDVFIGPFVEIQSDVQIGARTKIQSHSFVCSLVSIGEDCFIGHGVMFAPLTLYVTRGIRTPPLVKSPRVKCLDNFIPAVY